MPTRFTHIVVDTDAELMPIARFWSALLDWPITFEADDEIYLEGAHFGIVFGPVPEPKTVKNRIHLDVAPYAADDHKAEVDRLIELGARHLDIGQGDVPWVVMADPEGNDFCVLTPRD